ncbi:uncharacterized protein [Euwallacea similis]|uniref:uncharacterized protein n=1 Tax=Euwallacea similis TaxID=1736056 RepID=UPI00344EAADD
MHIKEKKKFKYFLIIDCFSKYVWIEALKSKSNDVTQAFSKVLKDTNRSPKNFNTDQEKEFYGYHFQNLMKKYGINHCSTFSPTKAIIAECCIRTIKEKLFKYFSLSGSYKWIDVLSEIVKRYNEKKYSTTKMRPIDVNKGNEKEILSTSYNHIKLHTTPKKLAIKDFVRISKIKHAFEKDYLPNWITELFKIIKSDRPIKSAFYEYDLQKTKHPDIYLVEKVLRRKGRKVYVKWLGFDKTHNSWIDINNKFAVEENSDIQFNELFTMYEETVPKNKANSNLSKGKEKDYYIINTVFTCSTDKIDVHIFVKNTILCFNETEWESFMSNFLWLLDVYFRINIEVTCFQFMSGDSVITSYQGQEQHTKLLAVTKQETLILVRGGTVNIIL